MRAGQLISGAAFPPDVIKVLLDAFEDAWTDLAPQFSTDPNVIEGARLSLAGIVLDAPRAGPIDRDNIKVAAVDAFRSKHRIGN